MAHRNPVRRLLARWTLVAIALAALAVGVLAAPASAAPATGRSHPDKPNFGRQDHAKIFSTIEEWRNKRFHTHAASSSAGSGPLTYAGGLDNVGVTTGPPKVYLVFWGSQWGTSTSVNGNMTLSKDSQGMAPQLQKLFKGLGTNNEQWSGVMTQYCEGIAAGSTACPSGAPHVGYPSPSGAYAGVWYDNSTAVPSRATGNQIAREAVAAASHFGQSANRNNQYVIVSPPGTHPDGFNTGYFGPQFCAWHDWNGDASMSGGAAPSGVGDIAFTNLPYLTDMGTSCGRNYVNAGAAGTLDGVSIVEGHEYAETVTDQNPAGGWTDATGYENGDKCSWNGVGGAGGARNVALGTGSFAMQATWSNEVNGCQNAHSTVTTSANSVTVDSPGTQSSTASKGPITPVPIAAHDTNGSTTFAFTAAGLPAGLQIDSASGQISGTPTTAGTSTVTVTATDSGGAFGSTSFTWTVSSGTGCVPGQQLGNPGFETGSAAPWTASSGVIDSSTGQPAHSGTWKAWLNGYGTTHTDTLAQTVTVPSGCIASTLSYYLHIDSAETSTTAANDKLTVQAQIGAGPATTLQTFSNLDKNPGYIQRSFNLPASYAGQTVKFTFTGTENGSAQTSFVIDDTAVNAS